MKQDSPPVVVGRMAALTRDAYKHVKNSGSIQTDEKLNATPSQRKAAGSNKTPGSLLAFLPQYRSRSPVAFLAGWRQRLRCWQRQPWPRWCY